MAEKDSNSETVNRRRVLKSLGAASSVAIGATGSTSAADLGSKPSTEELTAVVDTYKSQEAVEQAFRSFGKELLQELSDQGFLQSSSVADLGIDNKEFEEFSSDTRENIVVSAIDHGGKPSGWIRVNKITEEYRIGLIVEPDTGRSYAEVKSRKSDTEDRKFITSNQQKLEPDDFCQTQTHGCRSKPDSERCVNVQYQCCKEKGCTYIIGYTDVGCIGDPCPTASCSNLPC